MLMQYELQGNRRVPVVHCGNCGKKMVCDDIDDVIYPYRSPTFYMICSNIECLSWCQIKDNEVIAYGTDGD